MLPDGWIYLPVGVLNMIYSLLKIHLLMMTQKLGPLLTRCPASTLVVGDDLFVTQSARLQQGIDQNLASAILIKPNQVELEEHLTVSIWQKRKLFIVSYRR